MPIYYQGIAKDGKHKGEHKFIIRVNYKDKTGKQTNTKATVYFQGDKRTAERQARKYEREYTEQVLTKPDKDIKGLTLQQLVDRYEKAKAIDNSKGTIRARQASYRTHIKPLFENRKINSITAEDLTEWKLSLDKKNIGISTKQNAYKYFKAFFTYAVKMDYLYKSPFDKVDNFKRRGRQEITEKDIYTFEELQKYLQTAYDRAERTGNYNYYLFFLIASETGMRKGEINALTFEDLYMSESKKGKKQYFLDVNKSVDQKNRNEKGEYTIKSPKNRSSYRNVSINEEIFYEILNITTLRDEAFYNSNPHLKKDFDIEKYAPYICGMFSPIPDTSLENENKAIAKEAGLKHIRIHDFRHTYVSIMYNEGMTSTDIAHKVGHSNVSITERTYTHFIPKEEDPTLIAFSRLKKEYSDKQGKEE